MFHKAELNIFVSLLLLLYWYPILVFCYYETEQQPQTQQQQPPSPPQQQQQQLIFKPMNDYIKNKQQQFQSVNDLLIKSESPQQLQSLPSASSSMEMETEESAEKNGKHYSFKPYGFGYDIDDGYGNKQWRHEKSSNPHQVMGSYGYRDKNGVMRQVDYIADQYGFRAMIKTTEPGTANSDPAFIKMHANPTPVEYFPPDTNYPASSSSTLSPSQKSSDLAVAAAAKTDEISMYQRESPISNLYKHQQQQQQAQNNDFGNLISLFHSSNSNLNTMNNNNEDSTNPDYITAGSTNYSESNLDNNDNDDQNIPLNYKNDRY